MEMRLAGGQDRLRKPKEEDVGIIWMRDDDETWTRVWEVGRWCTDVRNFSKNRQILINDWLWWVKRKRELCKDTHRILSKGTKLIVPGTWQALNPFVNNELANTFASTHYTILTFKTTGIWINKTSLHYYLFLWLSVHSAHMTAAKQLLNSK